MFLHIFIACHLFVWGARWEPNSAQCWLLCKMSALQAWRLFSLVAASAMCNILMDWFKWCCSCRDALLYSASLHSRRPRNNLRYQDAPPYCKTCTGDPYFALSLSRVFFLSRAHVTHPQYETETQIQTQTDANTDQDRRMSCMCTHMLVLNSQPSRQRNINEIKQPTQSSIIIVDWPTSSIRNV